MWSMKEMFYGEAEPVWIVKPEKEDKKSDEKDSEDKKSDKNTEKAADYSILTSVPYYPYYYPDYYIASAPVKKVDPNAKKETKVMLKVPICCGECEEAVTVALKQLKGVKSVECDTRKEKVTVVATTVGAADILMECRKVFKKSRFWNDDD